MQYNKAERLFLRRIGEGIREAREKKKWSQEDLGFESGVHRTYIGAVERGERNLSLLSLRKIVGALGVSATAVLGEEAHAKK
ncbi:MAG: helix-turn-helix transcriptional regulator [Candidatus Kapaibacterium sp.]|jgi:transcriptional regulator with XRE-family HTH domain